MKVNLPVKPAFFYIKQAYNLGSKGGSKWLRFFDYYGLVKAVSIREALILTINSYHDCDTNIGNIQVLKTKQVTKNKTRLLVEVKYKVSPFKDGSWYSRNQGFWVELERESIKKSSWSWKKRVL